MKNVRLIEEAIEALEELRRTDWYDNEATDELRSGILHALDVLQNEI